MPSQDVSSQPAGELDLAPHRAWRRFVPAWLRSLIWVDSASRYDAFLSYSWKSDRLVAPVIQSVLQGFLRPWNKIRAKTVFRDLSNLPAGSSLQKELFDRIDRSQHFIVLASPEAATSAGMNIEARYWFSRPRNGEVLVIVTKGSSESWDKVRKDLLPPETAKGLAGEPLWIPLQQRRDEILSSPSSSKLRGELVEDLKQVLLRLHAPATWEELHGIERARRQRALWAVSGVATVLLTLAVGAGALAWMEQRQRNLANKNANLANENAQTAEARARIALSRQLALQVFNELPKSGKPYEKYNIPLSLLLSVQALRTSDTLEARSALLRAMQHQPFKSFYLWPEAGHSFIHGVLLSDQRQLIVVQDDGSILRHDLTTGDTKRDASPVQNGKIRSAVLSPDGQMVAFHLGDTIILYDVSTHSSTETNIKVPDKDGGARLAFSLDGGHLVAVKPDQSAVLWDVSQRQVSMQLPGDTRMLADNDAFAPYDTALSPNGKYLAFAASNRVINNDVEYWALEGTPRRIPVKLERGDTVSSVALHDNLLGVGTGALPGSSGLPQEQQVSLWDSEAGKKGSFELEVIAPPTCLGFSNDGFSLVAAYSEGFVMVLSTQTEEGTDQEPSSGNEQGDRGGAGQGHLETEEGPLYALPMLNCWISVGKPLDRGRFAVALVTAEGAYAVDTASKNNLELDDKALENAVAGEFRDLLLSDQTSMDKQPMLAQSLDGKTAIYQLGEDIVLKNVKTGATLGQPLHMESVDARKFAVTSGGRVATADDDGKLTVWDASAGKSTVLAEKDSDTLAFNSDGTILAVGMRSGAITLWDVVSGRMLSSLSSQNTVGPTTIIFSPDGQNLASTRFKSADVTLWDVASQRELDFPVNFGMKTTTVDVVGFSSDSKRLLVRGDDGLSLIDIDPKSWMQRVCRMANRNLTCDEWHSYIGSEPYEKTCPNLPAPPDCK